MNAKAVGALLGFVSAALLAYLGWVGITVVEIAVDHERLDTEVWVWHLNEIPPPRTDREIRIQPASWVGDITSEGTEGLSITMPDTTDRGDPCCMSWQEYMGLECDSGRMCLDLTSQSWPTDDIPAASSGPWKVTTGWEGVGVGGPECDCQRAAYQHKSIQAAIRLLDEKKPVEARDVLNVALHY